MLIIPLRKIPQYHFQLIQKVFLYVEESSCFLNSDSDGFLAKKITGWFNPCTTWNGNMTRYLLYLIQALAILPVCYRIGLSLYTARYWWSFNQTANLCPGIIQFNTWSNLLKRTNSMWRSSWLLWGAEAQFHIHTEDISMHRDRQDYKTLRF